MFGCVKIFNISASLIASYFSYLVIYFTYIFFNITSEFVFVHSLKYASLPSPLYIHLISLY